MDKTSLGPTRELAQEKPKLMQIKLFLMCAWAVALVLKPCTDVPNGRRPSSSEHGEGFGRSILGG